MALGFDGLLMINVKQLVPKEFYNVSKRRARHQSQNREVLNFFSTHCKAACEVSGHTVKAHLDHAWAFSFCHDCCYYCFIIVEIHYLNNNLPKTRRHSLFPCPPNQICTIETPKTGFPVLLENLRAFVCKETFSSGDRP